MTGRRAGRLVLLALLLGVLAGCGGSGATTGAAGGDPALRTDLSAARRAADLDPCPVPGRARGPLPAVTLSCLGTGQPLAVGDLRGPMLVNIWASWCGPCYQEMPFLQRLHAAAGDRLTVLGVDTSDTDSRGLSTVRQTGVHYPSVADPHRTVAAALGISTQPTTVFVRADGSVAGVVRTPITSQAQLTGLVHRYLGITL